MSIWIFAKPNHSKQIYTHCIEMLNERIPIIITQLATSFPMARDPKRKHSLVKPRYLEIER